MDPLQGSKFITTPPHFELPLVLEDSREDGRTRRGQVRSNLVYTFQIERDCSRICDDATAAQIWDVTCPGAHLTDDADKNFLLGAAPFSVELCLPARATGSFLTAAFRLQAHCFQNQLPVLYRVGGCHWRSQGGCRGSRSRGEPASHSSSHRPAIPRLTWVQRATRPPDYGLGH
jgi:hypothetical protein